MFIYKLPFVHGFHTWTCFGILLLMNILISFSSLTNLMLRISVIGLSLGICVALSVNWWNMRILFVAFDTIWRIQHLRTPFFHFSFESCYLFIYLSCFKRFKRIRMSLLFLTANSIQWRALKNPNPISNSFLWNFSKKYK